MSVILKPEIRDAAKLLDKSFFENSKWDHFHIQNDETNRKILENVEGLRQSARKIILADEYCFTKK